jgi:hypothetical protein
MQKEKISEKDQTKNITPEYIRSLWHHEVLAHFIDDVETGACLECGFVHSFSNIDEALKREHQRKNNNNTSPYLDTLFFGRSFNNDSHNK